MQTNKILFLGKRNDSHCQKAAAFIEKNFKNASIYFGEWGDSLPEKVKLWRGDYIISYLSRWIIPDYLIKETKVAAINFHPATPHYPGIGCNNFALYEEAEEYGVTCHHMAQSVDTGDIIAVKRFPVFQSDDISSLLSRTYDFQLILYYEVLERIIKNEPLPSSNERWTRESFSRKQLDNLSIIEPYMQKEEIKRRIRATSYQEFQPTVEIAGHIFELKTT